jgi:SAM-dependent methyltransferase
MPQCRVCRSDEAKLLWEVRGSPDYRVYLCPSCEARSLSPQPTESHLRELYSKGYYDAWGYREDSGPLRDMKLSTFRLRLEVIKKYKPRGTVLDVGCATGFFLEAAREAGFTPFGVEFSDYSSKIAKAKFGEDAVFEGVLEDCPFPERHMDVVTMFDLLEHVRDPHSVLEKTWNLLKDDGIVVIMTPDTDSLTQRLMREKWVHYKIEHLYYFNRKSIRLLADRHGFRLVHLEPARKTLNLAYSYHQFQVYRHWLLTPIIGMLHAILPEKALQANIQVTVGEMVAVLQKQPPVGEAKHP